MGTYEDVRAAYTAVLVTLSDEQLRTTVPATPAWTVHDVTAHVVGLAADINALRFPDENDIGGDAWGAAQVASRAAVPLAGLLAEWDREGPVFDHGLQLFGRETETHFVGDLVTHVIDVADALGVGIELDDGAIDAALEHYTNFVTERLHERGAEMPAGVAAMGRRDRLRLLSARRPLSGIAGADVLRSVFDGTGYSFPPD